MDTPLLLAALGWWIIGIAHSWAGERLVIGPLLAHPHWPELGVGHSIGKSVLRFAWHLTTLAWWGLGLMVFADAIGMAPVPYLEITLGIALLNGVVALLASRGRHPAWVVFFGIAVCIAVHSHGDWLTSSSVRYGLGAVMGVVLLGLAGLHVYWILGGRKGLDAALPAPLKHHPQRSGFRLLTLGITACLALAALLVLNRGGVVRTDLDPAWVQAGVAVLSAVFALRVLGDFRHVGIFKRRHPDTFARYDTRLYVPLCWTLSAVGVVLSL